MLLLDKAVEKKGNDGIEALDKYSKEAIKNFTFNSLRNKLDDSKSMDSNRCINKSKVNRNERYIKW